MLTFSIPSPASFHPLVPQQRVGPNRSITKLLSLQKYEDGWHFGEGLRFGNDVFEAAFQLLFAGLISNPYSRSDVFPGVNGEIRVSFYIDTFAGLEYQEFTVEKDLSVQYRYEVSGSGLSDERSFPFNSIYNVIAPLLQQSWYSFDSSPYSITTPNDAAFRISPSTPVLPDLGAGFQFSLENAWRAGVKPTVHTFQASVQAKSRRSSDSIKLSSGNMLLKAM